MSSGPVADQPEQRGALGCGSPGAGAQRALRLAGRARRVDHRRARLAGVGRHRISGRRGVDQRRRPAVMPVERRTVEHEDVLDLGDLRADLLEERRELGVDVDDRRVAVVGDVRRLLGRQPVVQRHRGRADLAGRVHDGRRSRASSARTRRPCGPGPAPSPTSTFPSWLARASSSANVHSGSSRPAGRRRRRACRAWPAHRG